MVVKARLKGQTQRRQNGVLSAWVSWLEESLLCLTAAATSSASDVS